MRKRRAIKTEYNGCLCDMDCAATEKAYRLVRQARFERSVTARVFPVRRTL